jgi:Mg/Co/Ni transporter MgtE
LFPKDQIEILNLVEGEEQRHLVRGCKHQNELLECLKANKCDNILDNYKKFSVSDLPEETIKDIFRELDEKEKLVFFNSISIDEKLELLQFVTKDEQVQLVEICNEQHNLIEHLLQTEQTPILENLMDSKLKETLIQFYEVTSNIKKLPDIDKNEAAESQQSVNNFLGGMDMLTTLHEIRSGLQSFFSNSNSTTKPKNDAGKKTDKQQKDQPPFSGGWGWW